MSNFPVITPLSSSCFYSYVCFSWRLLISRCDQLGLPAVLPRLIHHPPPLACSLSHSARWEHRAKQNCFSLQTFCFIHGTQLHRNASFNLIPRISCMTYHVGMSFYLVGMSTHLVGMSTHLGCMSTHLGGMNTYLGCMSTYLVDMITYLVDLITYLVDLITYIVGMSNCLVHHVAMRTYEYLSSRYEYMCHVWVPIM